MGLVSNNDLVDLQARVIIIKSYVQYIYLESATISQCHDAMEFNLAKLQVQVRELENLTQKLCDAARDNGLRRIPVVS